MILHRYSHRGTLPFPKEVTLDFDALPQVIAVSGPNGAGKTTMFDTIIAAFYLTMPFRPGPLHQIFKARGFIDVIWSQVPDGPRYRSRVNVDPVAGRTEASLFPAEGGPSIAGPLQKNYLDKIRELLGPFDVFLCTAYTVQPSYTTNKNAFSFLLAERAHRRIIMAELLGLKAYGMHEAGAKDKIRALETKIAGCRALIKQFEGHVAKRPALEEHLADAGARLATARTSLNDAQRVHVDAQERLRNAREQLMGLVPYQQQKVTLEAEIGALGRRDALARTALAKAEARIAEATTAGWAPARKEALLQEQAAIEPLKAQADRVQREIDEIEVQLEAAFAEERVDAEVLKHEDAILSAVAALADIDRDLVALDAEIEQQMVADARAASEYKDWLRVYDDLRHRVMIRNQIEEAVALMDDVPCKGQDAFAGCKFLVNAARAKTKLPDANTAVERLTAQVGEDRQEPVAAAPALKAQRDQRRREREALTTLANRAPELTRAQDRATALNDRINRLGADRTDRYQVRNELQEQAKRLPEIQTELARIEPLVQLAATLGAVSTTADEARKQIEQVAADLEQKQAALASCDARLADLQALAAQVDAGDRAVMQGATAVRQAQTVVTAIEREVASVTTLHAAVLEAETRLAAAQAELIPLQADLEDWLLLGRAFSPTGIPALKVDRALPEIGALATDLLRECLGESLFTISLTTQKTSADEKKLLETLDVIITRGAEVMGAELLSGGEGVLISEALSLAIALFNASRAGHRPYTLFRDEVGAALDAQRAPAFTRLLARAAKLGGFDKVLFVSHNEAAQNLADARLGIADGGITIS